MKCALCGDRLAHVADVWACKLCRDDGTANEIPKDMPQDGLLIVACEKKPGLFNRFAANANQLVPTLQSLPEPLRSQYGGSVGGDMSRAPTDPKASPAAEQKHQPKHRKKK